MIVTVAERPDLVEAVAAWRVAAFGWGGLDVAGMAAAMRAPPVGPEQAFVMLEGGRPVGTAALLLADLDARPDLGPWLAGVFVAEAARGRGFGTALVRHVEGHARAAGVETLWLYTADGPRGAEALYARLGWVRVGTEVDAGAAVALMRRGL